MNLVKTFTKLYYKKKFNFILNLNDLNLNKDSTSLIIANHPSLSDGIYAALFAEKIPVFVIEEISLVDKFTKFLLDNTKDYLIKRTKMDVNLVKRIEEQIKNNNVLIFPEQESSFFGKNNNELNHSISKLVKHLNKDVFILKINGAYLAKPRWTKENAKKAKIELNYIKLFNGSELKDLSETEIYNLIKENLNYNDFTWNDNKSYYYQSKKRAEGLENYIYVCPKCLKNQTLYTKQNDIYCETCGYITSFDEYSKLIGLNFNNLVEWDNLQKNQLPNIIKNVIYTEGQMSMVELKTYETFNLGHFDCEIYNEKLFVQNKMQEYVFEIKKIQNLKFKNKNDIYLEYSNKTYLFKLKDPMIFYDLINYLRRI